MLYRFGSHVQYKVMQSTQFKLICSGSGWALTPINVRGGAQLSGWLTQSLIAGVFSPQSACHRQPFDARPELIAVLLTSLKTIPSRRADLILPRRDEFHIWYSIDHLLFVRRTNMYPPLLFF